MSIAIRHSWYRYWRAVKKKVSKTNTKSEEEKIKSDCFTESNREKFNIAIDQSDNNKKYFAFGCTNIIFANCIHLYNGDVKVIFNEIGLNKHFRKTGSIIVIASI